MCEEGCNAMVAATYKKFLEPQLNGIVLPSDSTAVILGCTHYKFLEPSITNMLFEMLGFTPKVIDPAQASAEKVARLTRLPANPALGRLSTLNLKVFATSDPKGFDRGVKNMRSHILDHHLADLVVPPTAPTKLATLPKHSPDRAHYIYDIGLSMGLFQTTKHLRPFSVFDYVTKLIQDQSAHEHFKLKHRISPLIGYSNKASLEEASVTLAKSQVVALLVGFPCNTKMEQPNENDGLVGALAIAMGLLGLGKRVKILVESSLVKVMCAACQDTKLRALEIIGFEAMGALTTSAWSDEAYDASSPSTWASDFAERGSPSINGIDSQAFGQQWNQLREIYRSVDQVIAIERSGRAMDGHYYSMSGKDLVQYISPINTIFEWAIMDNKPTHAIGDGGNELGLGQIYDAVQKHIEHGPKIACKISCDNVILASVSDWGGYALGMMNALNCANTMEHALSINGLMSFLDTIAAGGVCDGMNGEPGNTSLDGLPITVTRNVLLGLREIVRFHSEIVTANDNVSTTTELMKQNPVKKPAIKDKVRIDKNGVVLPPKGLAALSELQNGVRLVHSR